MKKLKQNSSSIGAVIRANQGRGRPSQFIDFSYLLTGHEVGGGIFFFSTNISLSKIRQSQKDSYYVFLLLSGSHRATYEANIYKGEQAYTYIFSD